MNYDAIASAVYFHTGILNNQMEHQKELQNIRNSGWLPPSPVNTGREYHGSYGPSNDNSQVHAYYRDLLRQPWSEIAKQDANFAKAFHSHQRTLTSWILSQRAFKDLAYDLALSLGITEKRMDTIYLQRVQEIFDGTNPNESLHDFLKMYAAEALEDIKESLRYKYGGELPNEAPSHVGVAPKEEAVNKTSDTPAQENNNNVLLQYKFRVA